ILIVLANLSFKNVVTYMCDKIDNSDNTKNSKKKKPFSGATINIRSKDNELPDIEFISDSFEKSSKETDEIKERYTDDDLKIIEVEPSIQNKKEIATSKTQKKISKENTKTQEVEHPSNIYSFPSLELLRTPKTRRGGENSERHMRHNA